MQPADLIRRFLPQPFFFEPGDQWRRIVANDGVYFRVDLTLPVLRLVDRPWHDLQTRRMGLRDTITRDEVVLRAENCGLELTGDLQPVAIDLEQSRARN